MKPHRFIEKWDPKFKKMMVGFWILAVMIMWITFDHWQGFVRFLWILLFWFTICIGVAGWWISLKGVKSDEEIEDDIRKDQLNDLWNENRRDQ